MLHLCKMLLNLSKTYLNLTFPYSCWWQILSIKYDTKTLCSSFSQAVIISSLGNTQQIQGKPKTDYFTSFNQNLLVGSNHSQLKGPLFFKIVVLVKFCLVYFSCLILIVSILKIRQSIPETGVLFYSSICFYQICIIYLLLTFISNIYLLPQFQKFQNKIK